LPPAPFNVGFILGAMTKTHLRRGPMPSVNNFRDFPTPPIACACLALSLSAAV